MGVLAINNDNFESEVLNSNKPVILDFYADWCGPCKMMSPVIDEISEEFGDKVKVCKINTDDNSELAEKYQIMSIPTIMVLKGGEITHRFIGVTDKSKIIEVI